VEPVVVLGNVTIWKGGGGVEDVRFEGVSGREKEVRACGKFVRLDVSIL
jgi:hypothetical protein